MTKETCESESIEIWYFNDEARVVTQICQQCGNRLQPQRARILKMKNTKQSLSALRGTCDVCRCTAAVSGPEAFGLAIQGAWCQSSAITQGGYLA